MRMVFIALVTVMAVAVSANADSVYIGFTAEIITINDQYCWCLPPEIAEGDTIHGYAVYELGAQDTVASPTYGYYEYSAQPNRIVVYCDGGYVFRTDIDNTDFTATVVDSTAGTPGDRFILNSWNNIVTIPGNPTHRIWLDLWDTSATALSSDSLPSGTPNFEDWPSGRSVVIFGEDFWDIQASILSFDFDPPSSTEAATPGVSLSQNWPNPFNPWTTIEYSLDVPSVVRIDVYDVTGRLVRNLVDRYVVTEGNHSISWDGRNESGQSVASGAYFYRLTTPHAVSTKKMVLLR